VWGGCAVDCIGDETLHGGHCILAGLDDRLGSECIPVVGFTILEKRLPEWDMVREEIIVELVLESGEGAANIECSS
jgi:hypothetical protein